MDKFKQRLIASSIAIVLLLLVVTFSHHPALQIVFVLFSIATTCLALKEYYHLAQVQGYHPNNSIGIACTFAYASAIYITTLMPTATLLPVIALFLFLIIFFIAYFKSGTHPLINLAISIFGIVYLTIPLTSAIQINFFSSPDSQLDGRVALAYVLIVTKATDIGAYFIGKGIGRTKLAPFISPKKTVEGALGGLVIALIASVLFHSLLSISIAQSLFLGAIISITAQFGDLAESLLKRDAGIKDSNNMPGLGGMLDVVDSLIFTFPLMYIILRMGWL